MPEIENRELWLTVKQFASVAGVSTQRIYQRLAKDLQSYYQEQNGSKYIEFQALHLFGIDTEDPDLQNTCKELAKDLQTPCKVLAKPLQSLPSDTERAALDTLRDRIAELSAEVAALKSERNERRIVADRFRDVAEQAQRERDTLRAELSGEKARAAEIAAERDRLAETVRGLTAAIQADAAARALTAREQPQAIDTAAQTADAAEGGADQHSDGANDQTGDTQSEGKRRSIFARLFKRGKH